MRISDWSSDVCSSDLIRLAGGRVVVRDFHTPADITALPEALVFNCTGLGSNRLFGDAELQPMRGQLAVLLPQPEVDYALETSRGIYMFSSSDGINLGGNAGYGNWWTEEIGRASCRERVCA